MRNNYYAAVIIPTCDSVRALETTLQSLASQTFDHSRLLVVVVDNASCDGTYERALQLATGARWISVYRLPDRTTDTRVLLGALRNLRLAARTAPLRYLTIVAPGSRLHPDSIERGCMLLDLRPECGWAIFEAELLDEAGRLHSQAPLLTGRCLLRKSVHASLSVATPRHKIHWFARWGAFDTTDLRALHNFLLHLNDWYSKSELLFTSDCLYDPTPAACVAENGPGDTINGLFTHLRKLKRDYRPVSDYLRDRAGELPEFYQLLPARHRVLAVLALQQALDALGRGEPERGEEALLFAEMVVPEITNDAAYLAIASSMQGGSAATEASQFFTQVSQPPPDGALCF